MLRSPPSLLPRSPLGALALRLSVLAALVSLSGCLERELVVETSEPAEVFVDGELIGTSTAAAPVRLAFDHYGTRQVTARAQGFLPTRQAFELSVPWYQVFPLGLVSDVLWPGTIRDEHHLRLELERRGKPRPAQAVAGEAKAFATDPASSPAPSPQASPEHRGADAPPQKEPRRND